MKKLFLWLKGLDRRIKFVLVGGLNTVVGVSVELGIYLLMGLPFSLSNKELATPIQILVATIVSYTIGTIHSYLWNKYFTFESKEKSVGEVLRFFSVYIVQLGVNYLLKLLLVQGFGMNTFIAMIVTLFVTTVMSYVGHTTFSFRKKKPLPEEAATKNNETTEDNEEYTEENQ